MIQRCKPFATKVVVVHVDKHWQLITSARTTQNNFDLIKQSLKQPVVFDGRNLFDPLRLQEKGIEYYGIGRGEIKKTQTQHSTPLLHTATPAELLPV